MSAANPPVSPASDLSTRLAVDDAHRVVGRVCGSAWEGDKRVIRVLFESLPEYAVNWVWDRQLVAVSALPAPEPARVLAVREEMVRHMVGRFLGWRLPEDFSPDGGISFQRYPGHVPVGTNLLDATQAEALVRHLLGDRVLSDPDKGSAPVPKSGSATPITREEADERLGRGLHAEWAEGIGWHYFASYDPPAALSRTSPSEAGGEDEDDDLGSFGDWRDGFHASRTPPNERCAVELIHTTVNGNEYHLYRNEAERLREQLSVALAAAPPAEWMPPDGFKLMPIKATPQMVHAMRYGRDAGKIAIGQDPKSSDDLPYPRFGWLCAENVYDDALKAAPLPPSPAREAE